MEKTAPIMSAAENADVVNNVLNDQQIVELINWKIKKLIKTGLFSDADAPDLQQQMLIILWKEWDKYDKTKASPVTFARNILNNREKNIIDKESRIRKKNGIIDSLDAEINEDGDTLADFISSDSYYTTIGNQARSKIDVEELKECVIEAIKQLDKDQQRFCYDILVGKTISDIARESKVCRMTIYKRYIYPIRSIFRDLNLDDFCRS